MTQIFMARFCALLVCALTFTQAPSAAADISGPNSAKALTQLRVHLDSPSIDLTKIPTQLFASIALSKADAATATKLLADAYKKHILKSRNKEMADKVIQIGKHALKFEFRTFGEKPEAGRSLFISMHGGGGAPKPVNDQQWRNQIGLYKPAEGVYVAPRASTDTWNLWHQGHIDGLFDRLIENMIAFHDVNPNRVYLMGYSAGGDGVYQLAPRSADRYAAAAMMAGHPNEAKPLGLRNIGFIIQVGERDAGYKRNQVAVKWAGQLAALQKDDPAGYKHKLVVHKGMGHWMNRRDALALPWMSKFTRNPHPDRVVWYQDDVTHTRFYWLGIAAGSAMKGRTTIATRTGQTIDIKQSDDDKLTIYLNDTMVDLDQPIIVKYKDKILAKKTAGRSIANIAQSLSHRVDPASIYSAKLEISLPK
jgi:hypothetical protein